MMTAHSRGNHKLEVSSRARSHEERDLSASGSFFVEVFQVLDDDIARATEKRRFVFFRGFDLNDVDVEVVIASRHLPDAEDNRRPIVVAVGEPHASHAQYRLSSM